MFGLISRKIPHPALLKYMVTNLYVDMLLVWLEVVPPRISNPFTHKLKSRY